jgi:hypothetical protein
MSTDEVKECTPGFLVGAETTKCLASIELLFVD